MDKVLLKESDYSRKRYLRPYCMFSTTGYTCMQLTTILLTTRAM